MLTMKAMKIQNGRITRIILGGALFVLFFEI